MAALSSTLIEPVDTVKTAPFDASRHESFGERVVGMLNEASLTFMLSIGHRAGLLDVLRRMNRPATTHEIANEAGLDERYVREWLGALVTGRVIDFDPSTRSYRLPPEHAEWLTRAAAPNNLAAIMQFMSMFGKIEDDVLECFRNGGGVPYEKFERFHEVMAEESFQSVVSALDDHILPLVDGLVESLERGVEAVDVGCGRGLALMRLAERFPKSRLVGYDFSEEAIDWANGEARRRGLTNVRFEVRDAAKLDDERRFDVVFTFDAIHDQVDPHAMLAGIHRAMTDDGLLLAQDNPLIEPRREKPRPSRGAVSLYDIDDALHDRVVGAQRVRTGRVLGRGVGAENVQRGRLQKRRRPHPRPRHHEQLLRLPQAMT